MLDQNKKKEIIAAYKNGLRFMETVRKFSIGTTTLARFLRESKVRHLRGGDFGKEDIRRSLTSKEEKKVVKLYTNGKSSDEIANNLDCSRETITATLKRSNVKMRSRGPRPSYFTMAIRNKLSLEMQSRLKNESYRLQLLQRIQKYGFRGTRPTNKYKADLTSLKYKAFRQFVLERDAQQCLRCKSKNRIQLHHIYSREKFPELVYIEGNCETLCISCHMREEATRKHHRHKHIPCGIKCRAEAR